MLEKLERFQILLLALIIGIAGIIATVIITSSLSKNVVSVTGSYSQKVISDRGTYEFEINAREFSKAASYAKLKKNRPIVENYLKEQGFDEKEIEVKPVNGYSVYHIAPNGVSTNQIVAFNASQRFVVKSNDVNKIKKLSTDIDGLTEKGIDITGYEPQYYYSKLSDLKIEMLDKASLDAKQRATAMLKATNNKVGKIQSVQMGVFQITPEDSTNVSDYGINDTSAVEKKVTSVANVTFRIK